MKTFMGYSHGCQDIPRLHWNDSSVQLVLRLQKAEPQPEKKEKKKDERRKVLITFGLGIGHLLLDNHSSSLHKY